MSNIQIITPVARQVAALLLEIGAIKLNAQNPFTWSSGMKSPIYCDNRLSLSFPEVRNYIKAELVQAIQSNFQGAEVIAGVATAGIPQGALIADAMQLPFIYVRSAAKGHGMTNLIEGKISPGKKVVVVEDLVSTGGSSLKAVEALQASGMNAIGMVAIFNYGFSIAENNFNSAGIKLLCLSNYDHLLHEAIKGNYIQKADLENLSAWRKDPESWFDLQNSKRIDS